MDEVKVLNDRKMKLSQKTLVAAFGLALAAIGISTGAVYSLVCGVLLLAALLFQKRTEVNEAGIQVIYDMKVFQYRESWLFSSLSAIHRETNSGTDLVALHVTKGAMSKQLILSKQDAEITLKAAQKANPGIHLGNAG